MRNPHSTWPVIMCIYNLPQWLCHKRKYLLLTTLISGPKQAGIDIDVFLDPLMEDMQKLWEHGVNVWDEYKKEYFNLKAIIFCMINDNLAHLSLTGQVKEKTECVICVDQMELIYLPSSSKLVYMWHHKFLQPKHRYHQWRSHFDGTIENEEAPKCLDGKFVFEIIKNINVISGKSVKGIKRKKSEKPTKKLSFKKQSIFFQYLPYWKECEIGHAIDTMHIEKGVFESTISLLLDIPSKTTDGLSAHKDLQDLEVREELHPQERPNGKAYPPPGSYTLTTEEKRAICMCLHEIRVPTGFSTNIKNLVSILQLKMSGYNTHDCHTMLSLFLAIAIRAVNHPYLKVVITCMWIFLQCYIKEGNRC
jgi:hypothetical protein